MKTTPVQPNRYQCPRCEFRAEQCPAKQLFDGLDPALEAELTRHRVGRRFDAGVTIVHHETPALAVLTVHAGRVALRQPLPDGRVAGMAVRGPGELIGVREVLAGVPYQTTVETLEPSMVCSLPRAEFRKAVAGCPELAFRLLGMLARESLVASSQLWLHRHADVGARTAHLIRSLATGSGIGEGPVKTPITMDRAELAVLVGASGTDLERALQDLAACGAIVLSEAGIEVCSEEALDARAP